MLQLFPWPRAEQYIRAHLMLKTFKPVHYTYSVQYLSKIISNLQLYVSVSQL